MVVPRYEWVEYESYKLKEGVALSSAVNPTKNVIGLISLEVKRCEALPTPPKRMERISVEGKVPRGKIVDCNAAVMLPCPRRSDRLIGVKRKDYVEKTPEPQDFGGDSDWEDDHSPSVWGCGDEDDDWSAWDDGAWNEDKPEDRHQDKGKGKMPEYDDGPEPLEGHTSGCCILCRRLIHELTYDLGAARSSIESLKIRMTSLEDSRYEDYKFLNQDIRKLFEMYRKLRKEGGAGAHNCSKGVRHPNDCHNLFSFLTTRV